MKTKKTTGLPDSTSDKIHLQSKKSKIDSIGELAGNTISTEDEQSVELLDNHDEIADQLNANVTEDERKLLDDAAKQIDSPDQTALENAKPDQYDEDGEPLNEKTGLSGNDLDVPGSELDDANEKIGEEDEENNSYRMDDEHEDDNNARQ